MPKFLIAVDGSANSIHAIEAVAQLARSSAQLEVLLVNVRNDSSAFDKLTPRTFHELDAALSAEQDRVLREAAARAGAAGLTVAATLKLVGLVAPEIMRAAIDAKVDQIVLGTRGLGSLGGLLLGSVAQRVVHLADVPVLLVK